MSVDSVYNFVGSRYVLAPGAVVQLGPVEGANAISVKLLTGGTLEIGGYSLSLTNIGFTTIAGTASWSNSGIGQTFGLLYPMSANEVYSGNFAGKMYLYASSATCVVAVTYGRSQGY